MGDRSLILPGWAVRAVLREIEAPGTGKSQHRVIIKNRGMLPDFRGPNGCQADPECWGWEDGESGYHIGIVPSSDGDYQDFWQPFAAGDRLWVKSPYECFPVYFKQIPFGDGKYAVGTDGHVYARDGDQWVKRAPRLSHNGYEEISLRYEGERRPFRVNRLVAEAFYGPAPDGYVCRHMNGSRRENRPENLDWGTPAQNSADAAAAGSFSGERASKARLTAEDVAAIRSADEPQAGLAGRYGVTQPTISKIKSAKRWAAPSEAPARNFQAFRPWTSPRFCPRWASRLTLIVADVRVQRVQDISEEDARAEGCRGFVSRDGEDGLSPREEYCDFWGSQHGPDAWARNPWVLALTFRPIPRNIDMEPRHG